MSYEKLYDEIDTELNRFTGSGAWFEKFEIRKDPPTRRALTLPVIVMEKLPAQGPDYGLGKQEMRSMNVHLDLIFKDGHFRTVGGSRLEQDDLASHYLERLQSFFSLLRLTSSDIGAIVFQGSTHKEPSEMRSDLMLYGAQADISVRFKAIN